MRKANTNDLFNIARLVEELNLKDDLFKAQHGKEDVEKIGFTFIYDIFAKATTKEMQNKIYEVIALPFEISADEVGLLDVETLLNNFNKCFDLKVIKNFIKRVNS